MPAEETTPAIVLRARDYSESDRVVTLLTRDFGKLGGMAKGAKASRRRFERKLEPFSHVVLSFRRRPHGELVFVTQADAGELERFNLEDELGKFALGSYMLELADALTTEQHDAVRAYEALRDALAELGRGGASAALRAGFELRMLGWAGLAPDFARCRVCGREAAGNGEAVYFIVGRGGVSCAPCRPGVAEGAIKISSASAVALARLGAKPLGEVVPTDAGGTDAALALARFIGSVLDRRLRSVEFLDSILPPGA